MANYTTTITNEGAALLASVIANQGTLTFNEFRFSENDYNGQESTLTEGTFLGVFITASAAASVIDSTTIKASAQFNNSTITGNHNLYSIGIVGTDGNTTALIAVCTTTDPDVIREPLTGTSTYAFNVNLSVSDTSQITVTGTTAAVLYDVDVVDTLISTATDKPLSANMGRVLGENVEAIVDVYGAKNLLAYPYSNTTKTENGITFTDNGDGTVTVSGTASANTGFVLRNADQTLLKGSYIMTGDPAGSSSSTYEMYLYDGVHRKCGTVFTESSDKTNITVVIQIYNGTSISTPITFYPMIRDSRIVDDTFVPYAKTNLQLTNDKAERADLATLNLTGSTNSTGSTIASGTFFYLNGSYCRAIADIANGTTFTLNTNFKVDTVGDELAGETGTFTLTFAAGTYTDGFSAQTNYYKRIGGLVMIRGVIVITGTPDASHSYVKCSGLPFKSKRYDIPCVGSARIANNAKLASVAISGESNLSLYFQLSDGTYPEATNELTYELVYEC